MKLVRSIREGAKGFSDLYEFEAFGGVDQYQGADAIEAFEATGRDPVDDSWCGRVTRHWEDLREGDIVLHYRMPCDRYWSMFTEVAEIYRPLTVATP